MYPIKPSRTPDGYIDHFDLALSLWIISDDLWESFESFLAAKKIPYTGAVYDHDLKQFAEHHQLHIKTDK